MRMKIFVDKFTGSLGLRTYSRDNRTSWGMCEIFMCFREQIKGKDLRIRNLYALKDFLGDQAVGKGGSNGVIILLIKSTNDIFQYWFVPRSFFLRMSQHMFLFCNSSITTTFPPLSEGLYKEIVSPLYEIGLLHP